MAPLVLVLTDTTRFPEPARSLEPLCAEAPSGSVGVVVRDRELAEADWLTLAEQLRELTERTQQCLILADRAEHASRLAAHGVHLGGAGGSPSAVRRAHPELVWLSRTWHGWDALPQFEKDALDAVLVSPVFAPRKGRPSLGLDRLSELAKELAPRAAYALGGAGSAELLRVRESGAQGVAMIEAAYVEEPALLAKAIGACKAQEKG